MTIKDASVLARSKMAADLAAPRRYFHIRTPEDDEASLLAVYRFCENPMLSRGLDMMGLAVHSKAGLDGAIRTVYGEQVTRLLDRENRSELRGNVIQLLTEKIQVRRLTGPVLAACVAPRHCFGSSPRRA